MFYLYSLRTNKHIKAHGKVITFNTLEWANAFKDLFIQYSILRMLNENPLNAGEVAAEGNSMQVIELAADSNIKTEDTIPFESL